jgi:CTP synthase (UTP-ammonia lyase)
MLTICIVGDYDPANETHVASTESVGHAVRHVGAEVEIVWTPTVEITGVDAPALRQADALLIAPGSPYRSMDGALFAITHARVHDIPLLGTCGGFQHLVVEYARNVLGINDAEHAESSPDAATHVITPLTCSLFGQRMDVDVLPGTIASAAYRRPHTTERYYCNFGLNPDYADALVTGGLVVSGTGRDGEVRILEHPALRFFMATLFVPQTSSTPDAPHPLLLAFVTAAARAKVSIG